jgi:hypothetical protein
MRADYKKRLEEWRARVDPRVLREMNRRRVAKGLPRIRGPPTGRPMTGYLRYVYNHVHLAAKVLRNVPATSCTYELNTHERMIAFRVTSPKCLSEPRVSGRQ